jgi:hypothetical protein
MARPQAADGGDGVQIWRVTVNILNNQSRTAEKGWSSSFWVLGIGLETHTAKNKHITKCHKGSRT